MTLKEENDNKIKIPNNTKIRNTNNIYLIICYPSFLRRLFEKGKDVILYSK